MTGTDAAAPLLTILMPVRNEGINLKQLQLEARPIGWAQRGVRKPPVAVRIPPTTVMGGKARM